MLPIDIYLFRRSQSITKVPIIVAVRQTAEKCPYKAWLNFLRNFLDNGFIRFRET